MHLESNKSTVNHPKEEIFAFLNNPANMEQIMPPDLDTFKLVDKDTIVFSLKGMPEITLRKVESVPPTQVIYGAPEGSFQFTLVAHVDAIDEGTSSVHWEFNGDFNAMMAMMIKNPITNFIQSLATNLEKI